MALAGTLAAYMKAWAACLISGGLEMNKYYIDGNEVSRETAYNEFLAELDAIGEDPTCAGSVWAALQSCEETRDFYLTGSLEIVQVD